MDVKFADMPCTMRITERHMEINLFVKVFSDIAKQKKRKPLRDAAASQVKKHSLTIV